MITIIKKITTIALALLVVVGTFAPFASVFAAAFNNDTRDYATLQVSNYTRNPGSNLHWSNAVSANAGEIVSFLVYYHNTATDVAGNTRVRVQLPTGAFTSQSIIGDVTASNATQVSGTASVTLTSSQTLTFIPGSVSWYPNRSTVAQPLPGGQNGSEIISANGLLLGDIAGGWASQGYVVFRAQVSSTTVQPVGSAPLVTTLSASSITQNSATVQASVNPNGSPTNAWFEYGISQSFGNTTSQQSIGSGTGSTNVTAYLSNLLPGTTYYYRAVAQNAFGTTYGNTLSFITIQSAGQSIPPYVTTYSASSITQNSATVQASVNPNGSPTNAWFEYGISQSFGNTSGYQFIGSGTGSTNVTAYLSNLLPGTTYYYRAVAQNAFGTTYGNTLSFATTQTSSSYGTVPSVYTNTPTVFGATNVTFSGNVNPNGNQTSAWFEYGLTQSLGYTTGFQSVGSFSYSSATVATVTNLAPNTTYYYRAVAQNAFGTSYGTIVSFTTSGSTTVPSSAQKPYVTTRTAESVYRNSALVNGNVNPNGSLATAWFEWGATASLGNRTMLQPVGSANSVSSYSAALTGLQAGTTYYYRAVAQNAYGTTYGNILDLATPAITTTPVVVEEEAPAPRVITQQIAVSGTTAPTVTLIPSVDRNDPRAGETVTYSIQYRNDGTSAITGAALKVLLPSEVSYENATLRPSTIDGNELTFDLGSIAARSQGVIIVEATIDTTVESGSALLFSATLNYTDAKKQFQSTSAYLTVMVGEATAGLASLSSVFAALLGNWFIDLLLGLLIGFGIYHFFVRKKEEEVLVK